jgi:hypothetical protein
MEFLKQHKTSLTILLVVVIAFILYGVFFTGGDEEGVLVSETPAPEAAVGGDLLNLLLTLQSVSIDESIFEHETFTALVDFGVQLVPEPVGRSNPFAPLGTGENVVE